jgi:DNA invertase Pin-like site-specific DNA recombinase
MELKTEYSGVLRALRVILRARYADVSDATPRREVSALENAQTSITLEQFADLAESRGISPVAMLALCIGHRDGEDPNDVIHQADIDLLAIKTEGIVKALREQFDAERSLVKRGRGKPLNAENEKAVLALKEQGATKQEVAGELGLALSSVREYWRKQ